MEMSYNGALVMPCNYVAMDSNEMAYVDGAYVSNGTLKNITKAFFLHVLSSGDVEIGESIWTFSCRWSSVNAK